MATKSEQGERSNVGGVSGATLSVIPGVQPTGRIRKAKKAKKPKTKNNVVVQSKPSAAAAGLPASKPVRITIQAEFGSFEEKAESKEAAMKRAEHIAAHGAWQKAGSRTTLHAAASIRRVTVVE